jgi:hypothetical protein
MKMPRLLVLVQSFVAKLAPWIVFVCLAVAMLLDPGRNTLSIASSAFAVTVALASVTFSYARTMKDGSAVRDEVIFAGERLVSGAALFLVASIVKYASNDVPRYVDTLFQTLSLPKQPPDITLFGQDPICILIAFTAYIFFLVGLINAQMGIMLLLSIVGQRAKRRPGHDEFFPSNKSVEKRVADLDQADRTAPIENSVAADRVPNV